MKIEIDYEIIPDEEFEEIKNNCNKILMELFVDSLKEKSIPKE
jgi:hypothetical protein